MPKRADDDYDFKHDDDELGVGLQHRPEDEEIGVYRTNAAGGLGVVMVPRSFKKLSADGREAVAEVQQIAAHIGELQQHLTEAVAAAREAGASWDLIGWSVGTTGRAAGMRWHERHDGERS